jgi:hypothetical protein
MKDEHPLRHEDFEKVPEGESPFWFIVAGGCILLGTGGVLWSSLRMMGIV